MKKKITIITPTFNSAKTILANLKSIKNQKYKNYEHIIVDNKSSDQTINLVKKNIDKKVRIILGKDKGIYDAINKGIKSAKGDIISILHSDDIYYDSQTLLRIVNVFKSKNINIVYGNLLYTSKHDTKKIIRNWRSNNFASGMFYKGWSPPHPTFFVKKKTYYKFGLYKQKIGNSADIELMHRYLEKFQISNIHINKNLVKMRYGGKSNSRVLEIIKQNLQIIKFLNLKGPLEIFKFIYFKIINRTLQFLNK